MTFELYLKAKDRTKGPEFRRWLVESFARSSGAALLSVSAEDEDLGELGAVFPASAAIFDAILSFGAERAWKAARERPELRDAVEVKIATVAGLVQKAGPPAPVGLRAGATLVAFITPDPRLTDDEFQRRWRDHTDVLFKVQRGPQEYVQNLFVAPGAGMAPYRGYARLRYSAIETLGSDMAPSYEGADRDGAEDVARFAVAAEVAMMREYTHA